MHNTRSMSIGFHTTLAVLLFLSSATVVMGLQDDAPKRKARIADLQWLAGHWRGEADGGTTEESWLAPAGGMMLAVNRTVSKSGRSSFEFLRIAETPDGLVYFASPSGRPATLFPLKNHSEDEVVFESPTHDFPQRIIYRRSGDQLHVRIEGEVDGKRQSMEWNWLKFDEHQPTARGR